MSCFKILGRKESLHSHFNCVHDGRPTFEKERLQPHFNCVHDDRPTFEKGQTKLKLGFSTTKRKVSEDEDLSSPTEDQIQCDACDNETPSASVESPPSFLPASLLFRPSSSTLPSLESNENLIGQMKVLLEKLEINVCRNRTNTSSPKSQSPTFSPPFQQKSTHTPTPESTNKIREQCNLISQSSCLKHLVTLLDDVFELNLEKTRLVSLFCHDPSTKQGVFDVTGVEF